MNKLSSSKSLEVKVVRGPISSLPKRKRLQLPRFAVTSAWRKLQAEIDAGIGVNEAVSVILTPEMKASYRLKSRRAITRFVQSYIKDKGLRYHEVRGHETPDGDLIAVAHVPVVRKTA